MTFERATIDRRLAPKGEGDAFQTFVFEMLESELPHLHPYPAGGKDGGIDHITDEPGKARTVVESWLHEGLPPIEIEPYLVRWLGSHGDLSVASKLMCRWMDAGGSLTVVESSVRSWLERWIADRNASWILVAWLKAKGDPKAMEPFVDEFIARNPGTKSTAVLQKIWKEATSPSNPIDVGD